APGTPIPAANFGANQVVFKPNANFNGNTNFTFKVQDNGGTANSGADTDTADRTISFTVNAISDEPVGQDKTINSTFNTNLLEDGTYTFAAADFGFSDPNDSPPDTFTNVIVNPPSAGT